MAIRTLSKLPFTVLPLLALLACSSGSSPIATNNPPSASAGPDMSASVGEVVHLNGSASHDPDNDNLTYSWSFVSRPAGSTASLSGTTSATPTFTPDVGGQYTIRLTVSDGNASATDDCVVTANAPPIAEAGPDRAVNVGELVQLDGSGSSDPENVNIAYSWSFQQRPAGSNATLSNPSSMTPTFTPDRGGEYRVRLIVNDGILASAPDDCTITANTSPQADAGPDQELSVDDLVMLDGGGSSDDDGDALSYSWSFTSRPAGSSATLMNPASVNPIFTADVEGDFVVALTVSDGMATSPSDDVTITATSPLPRTGQYSGTTSQGQPISFALAQDLNSVLPGLMYTFTTCFGTARIEHTVSRALVDGQFNWSGPGGAVAGWSTSATTFSGTARYIDRNWGCLTVDVTWTANWTGPAPILTESPLEVEVLVTEWHGGATKE